MGSIEEDLRKIMNKDPFADPFIETFDPATDSLEALRDAINGIEAGIYTYTAKSGPVIVELNDGSEFSIELLNPGDVVIPVGSITPGNYTIDRIRDNILTNIVASTPASKAAGRIYCTYQFTAAAGWAVGDLYKITFSGGSVTIGGTTTAFPDAFHYGRIVREEVISDRIGVPPANLVDIVTMLGNPNVVGKSIYGDIGDFVGQANLQSLLAALGIPDVAGKPLYTCIVTDRLDNVDFGLNALHGDIGDKGAGVDIITRIGAFDGGADPQGDIFQALGVPVTNSIWSGVQYIHHAAIAGPAAGSLANVLAEAIYGRVNTKNLHGLLGVPDAAGKSIYGDIGDFMGQANLQTLLAALGIPDVAGKPLYTCIVTDRLGAVGDAAAEAGTLLPRLKFYGQGIIKGTGTEIPADKSLYDAIGLVLARANNPSLYGMLGVADAAGRSLTGNLGDFQAQANLQSLLAALGIPDVAGKPLYNCIVTDRLGAVGDAAAEAGTLLPRLKFYGQGIIKGAGTEIPANKSLYDAIGMVLARANDPSILDILGFPDVANGSLYERLGAGLTNINNLYDIIGGYTNLNTIKMHLDPIKAVDITAITLVARSMAYYIRGIGINVAVDGFDSSAVTANEDGSILERLEHLKSILDDNVADNVHTITVAHGVAEQTVTTFTAHRTGELAIELDVNTLILAGEGGIVTVRLKHMIDNVTLRTIGLVQFVVGVDEIHPTVKGWVDSANPNGVRLTIQCSIAVTANRDIPYKILEAA